MAGLSSTVFIFTFFSPSFHDSNLTLLKHENFINYEIGKRAEYYKLFVIF